MKYITKDGTMIKDIISKLVLVELEDGSQAIYAKDEVLEVTQACDTSPNITFEELAEHMSIMNLSMNPDRNYGRETGEFIASTKISETFGEWRLPTVYELSHARERKIKGFGGFEFWASDEADNYRKAGVFGFEFDDKDGFWIKTKNFHGRLVRENKTHLDNIEWGNNVVTGDWFSINEFARDENNKGKS